MLLVSEGPPHWFHGGRGDELVRMVCPALPLLRIPLMGLLWYDSLQVPLVVVSHRVFFVMTLVDWWCELWWESHVLLWFWVRHAVCIGIVLCGLLL